MELDRQARAIASGAFFCGHSAAPASESASASACAATGSSCCISRASSDRVTQPGFWIASSPLFLIL